MNEVPHDIPEDGAEIILEDPTDPKELHTVFDASDEFQTISSSSSSSRSLEAHSDESSDSDSSDINGQTSGHSSN